MSHYGRGSDWMARYHTWELEVCEECPDCAECIGACLQGWRDHHAPCLCGGTSVQWSDLPELRVPELVAA